MDRQLQESQLDAHPEEMRRQRILHRQDEFALALLRELRTLGARMRPELIVMAAREGHLLVVRELLDCGLNGSSSGAPSAAPTPNSAPEARTPSVLNVALSEALRNARHAGRGLQLARLLQAAGATLSPEEQCSALSGNTDVLLARALLAGLGLGGGQPGAQPQACNFGHALRKAVEARDQGLVKELLSKGVVPELSHLYHCCAWGDDHMFAVLLQAALAAVPSGSSAVASAAAAPDAVPEAAGCDPPAATPAGDLALDEALWWTASQHGRMGILRQLMAAARSPPGQGLLQASLVSAFSKRGLEPVEELLRAGADPLGARAACCVRWAAETRDLAALRLLLRDRREPGHPELREALARVCRGTFAKANDAEAVSLLLAAGADPLGLGLLSLASSKANVFLLWTLLQSGAYPPGCLELREALNKAISLRGPCAKLLELAISAGTPLPPDARALAEAQQPEGGWGGLARMHRLLVEAAGLPGLPAQAQGQGQGDGEGQGQ